MQYLQSNKVLGAIAFAYGFHKNGVARAPHKQLHYYADMFEAFIEHVFEDDPSAGTEWLKALWSSRSFPDLRSCIKEHGRSKGECQFLPPSSSMRTDVQGRAHHRDAVPV